MGAKSSNNFQSNRPESGGADKDDQREKSGHTELDKERFAVEQAERHASAREASEKKDSFSIDNEPNNDPNPASRED